MANSPHDALFRYTFGQPEHAGALLRTILPAGLVAGIDWSTLTALPGTRLDARLRRHQTDLLFAASLHGRDSRILVLVEHARRSDRWLAFRMLAYAVDIWRQIRREEPRRRRLPHVIPVIVHQCRRRFRAAASFVDLLETTAAGHPIPQPKFDCTVRSFSAMPPAQLDTLALTVLGKVTLATMQYLPGASRDEIVAAFARWCHLFDRVLEAPSGEEAMAALSEYVLTTTRVHPEVLIEIAEHEMTPRTKQRFETAADILRREGRIEGLTEGLTEGRTEGRTEGQCRMLRRQLLAKFGALPLHAENRLAHATEAELDTWSVRLLDATSIDAVFAD